MWARGLLVLLSVTGRLRPLDAGIFQYTLQLVSNGLTFVRVDEPLSWPEAQRACRLQHTDLADLQSAGSLLSLADLYSLTSSTAAWLGLYFDVATRQLRWSSGSVFTAPAGMELPQFGAGVCATVFSTLGVASLGADVCTARKPFICYYDKKVGHRLTTRPPLSLTTSAKPVEVQLGGRTFLLFERLHTWPEALVFCRRHCTDLADLQALDEPDLAALQPLTAAGQEAWIGLYFSAASRARSWSSDLGDHVPGWLKVPEMGVGLCAGLGVYRNFGLRASVTSCSARQPFICFHDPAIGHRPSAAPPLLYLSYVGTTAGWGTPAVATAPEPASEDPSSAGEPLGGDLAPQEEVKTPGLPVSTQPAPPVDSTSLQEVTGTRPAPSASPTVTEPPVRDSVTPSKWTMTQVATLSPARSTAPQGMEEQASETPATPQSSSAWREGAAQSSPGHPESGTAPTSARGDADSKDTAPASGAPQHSTPESQPEQGRHFGILKADFKLAAHVDPEESREQLLQEVHRALQLTLGPEPLQLKWVALEDGHQ